MNRELIIKNKKCKMPKMDVDTYMEYLDLKEVCDADTAKGYNRQMIESMILFICKAYGNQFTTEELKDIENGGLDAAGIVLEFQLIDMGVAQEMTDKMEKIQKNFTKGK